VQPKGFGTVRDGGASPVALVDVIQAPQIIETAS
jgi:hypothetical protein